MSRFSLLSGVLMIASFAAGGLVSAQLVNDSGRIYIVDYMKVEPGTEDAYLELEVDWWKPVHAERIRSGSMRSWSLYRVRYPDGTAREYDFVTVNAFDTFADSEADPFGFFAEIYPDVDPTTMEQRTLAARRLVRGELWQLIDHVE